jgi:3',5'-cyclic-AMP phosphodiesterase
MTSSQTANPKSLTPMLQRRDFLKVTAGLLAMGCQRPAAAKGQLRFAVASDGHYGQPKTEYKAYFDHIVTNLQNERRLRKLDFCVFNGDLFHDDVKFLPEVKAQFERLGFPYYVTRGNHDHVTPEQWRQTWGYDLNHVVEMGRNAIILADSSNEKGEYKCPDVAWLDARLAELKDKQHVFLFVHIPYKKWSEHGVVCSQMESVLAKYPNLKAGFHGHDHAIDVGKIGEKPFFFDGHFGGNWGTKYRGYRVVEANRDNTAYTYQWNPEADEKVNEMRF